MKINALPLRFVAAVLCLFLSVPTFSAAGDNAAAAGREKPGRSDALGINYPGGNLRIYFSDAFAAELRGQYADRVLTGGARLYYYPAVPGFSDARLRPLLGVEGARVSFRGKLSKGSGAAFGALAGMEYFISRRIAVQTDAGPYYILLKDSHTSIRQNGLEFVLNFGVNFYLN